MFNNLEMQARMYFLLKFMKDNSGATQEEALSFAEKCWQEFIVQTTESWFADIYDLLHERENSCRPLENSPRLHCETRVARKKFARV